MKAHLFIWGFLLITYMCIGKILDFPLKDLNQLAEKYGTDKGAEGRKAENYYGLEGWQYKSHNYARIYEYYLSCLKRKNIKFLEIGFLSGASARMWDEYFSKGNLYFIDIEEKYFKTNIKNLSSRCHFYVADQGNKEALERFIFEVGEDFDVILDDGGHHVDQQITSFKTLFPHLKSGGVYIVEDLHTSYVKYFGGLGSRENPKAGSGTAIYFFQMLIDDLNYSGARTGCADKDKCPELIALEFNYYQKNILSIHFYDSLCFIFKK